MDAVAQMGSYKLMPVLRIDKAEQAVPLAEALQEGGLPCAEITFRTPCAAQALEKAVCAFPSMLIGAGTVTCGQEARRAYDAGAKFIVGPGWDEETARFCLKKKLAYIPGCVTPGEIMRAAAAGFSAVKFFPASVFGGPKAIRALSAPFPGVRFMPTGGIKEDDLSQYLSEKSVFAVGGSWMVPEGALEEGAFGKIAASVSRAVSAVREFQKK